jgi:hypothetical protein
MLQTYVPLNFLDDDGNPAGGSVNGVGLRISWQNGPLGRGADRVEPNGAFVETVIAAAVQRLNFYQTASNARFACVENLEAIEYLLSALGVLQERTARREAAQTEGTHEGS